MAFLIDPSTNKDETIESIRDEVRQEKLSNRQFQRDFELNRTRSILGNLNNDDTVYNEKYVIETARLLRKKTLPIQEYRKFQNALIQVSQNNNRIQIIISVFMLMK